MTTTTLKSGIHCAPLPPRRSIWSRFAMIMSLRRQRLSLKKLDARMLDDIGVSRKDAAIEAKKSVWDVPGHWSQ